MNVCEIVTENILICYLTIKTNPVIKLSRSVRTQSNCTDIGSFDPKLQVSNCLTLLIVGFNQSSSSAKKIMNHEFVRNSNNMNP